MKKSFLLTVIVMMTLMIVSAVCADDLSDVKQAGVLRFGAPLEYIPFVFQDENDKKILFVHCHRNDDADDRLSSLC